MKIYEIMLGIFIINLALGFYSNLATGENIQDDTYTAPEGFQDPFLQNYTGPDNLRVVTYKDYASNLVDQTEKATGGGLIEDISAWVAQAELLLGSIGIIISAIWDATIGLPVMLMQLGVVEPLRSFLTGGVWLVYFIGLFQLASGRHVNEGA